MKFGYYILLLVLVCLPVVYASEGRTFEINFNVHDEYDLWLKKSDRVLFEYGGYNHTIIIDEIKNSTAELDVFLFLEAGLHTPDYTYLTKQYNLRLDFNKDGKYEIEIKLLNIELNRVNILFKKLENWDSKAIIKPSWAENKEKEWKGYIPFVIGGIALIIIFTLILKLLMTKWNKGTYF